MDMLYYKLYNRLKFSSKIVFMGIGEEKLSDDGVGPYLISKLLNYNNEKFLFINAGTDPMARIDDIIKFKPSHLILFDTCSLNEVPGTIAIIERNDIHEYVPISSHTIPIHIVIDLILKQISSLEVFMVGFVPESLEGFKELKIYEKRQKTLTEMENNIELPFFQINLTPTVKKVADKFINIIIKIINSI